MRSRLKGIETTDSPRNKTTASQTLDMVSRLKGIETLIVRPSCEILSSALDMRSRLKGIETFCRPRRTFRFLPFGYGFPFEGN